MFRCGIAWVIRFTCLARYSLYCIVYPYYLNMTSHIQYNTHKAKSETFLVYISFCKEIINFKEKVIIFGNNWNRFTENFILSSYNAMNIMVYAFFKYTTPRHRIRYYTFNAFFLLLFAITHRIYEMKRVYGIQYRSRSTHILCLK